MERTLRCDSTTPLGSPVDPEVKITVAVASRWSSIEPGDESPHEPERHQFGDGRGPELVGQPHLLADILEQDQLPLGSDLEPIEHFCRGQDVRDPALIDRGIDQALAGGIVEVDRNLAPERDGEIGHGGRHRRRHQQADVLGRPPDSSQDAAQDQGANQRLAISQARARAVGHGLT